MSGQTAIRVCLGAVVLAVVVILLAALGSRDTPVGPDGIHPIRHFSRGVVTLVTFIWIVVLTVYMLSRSWRDLRKHRR
jgi:hypothetical protein